MCNKLPNCPYGKKCRFAHSEKELRHVTRDDKYKTVRCKNYDKTGTCTYGHRCRFIHSDAESVALADSWRTPRIPLRNASNEEAMYVWSSWAIKCKDPPAPLEESRLAQSWAKK